MKFNRLLYFGLALAAATFTGCNEVDEQDRFQELEKIESKRKVLIEDFTGQNCTNCPDAHRVIATLQEQYGEQIVAVGIHAGSFGIGEGAFPNIVGLMLPEGNELATKFKVEGYPAGVIDRRTAPLKHTEWAGEVRNALIVESSLNIELKAMVEGNNIVITTNLLSAADIKGKLQLWITESDITAMQVDNGKLIKDYVHNHVFRGSVNGTWGEDISLEKNRYYELNHTIAVKDNWTRENLAVVAFVYNDAEGVFQTEECKVGQ